MKTEEEVAAQNKKLFKKIGIVIGAIILFFIVVGALSGGEDESSNESTRNEAAKEEKVSISQREAEETCQNAEMLQSYLDLKKTTILKLDSNTIFDGNTGYFTVDKTPISVVNWQGKDKETDENISFMCSVGRMGERIVVHQLVISGETVYSQEMYNKDGEVIE